MSFDELFDAIFKGEAPSVDAKTLELAAQAVERNKAPVDIEEWARRLVADIAHAND